MTDMLSKSGLLGKFTVARLQIGHIAEGKSKPVLRLLGRTNHPQHETGDSHQIPTATRE